MGLICPKCLGDMNEVEVEGVAIDVCGSCRGIWLDPGELALLRGADTDLPHAPEQRATGPRYLETTTYICPRCEGGFDSFEYAEGSGLIVDRCKDCAGIYLDAGELQKVQAVTAQRRALGLTSTDDQGRRLREAMRSERRRGRHIQAGGSSTGVYFFQLLTGLPVEVDAPRQRFPAVVLGLLLLNVAAFVLQRVHMGAGPAEQAAFFHHYGLVPAAYGDGQAWWTAVSAMFLHGGWLHLLANLYFLWLFGDNVEDRLNRGVFLIFYLACGLAAFAVHGLLTPQPEVPTVGASGAISGVMGAYLVLYPRRQMYQVLWFIQFRISVVFYLLFWLGLQVLLSAWGGGGVAWFAHIGGFAAGAAGLWLLDKAGLVRPDPFAAQATG